MGDYFYSKEFFPVGPKEYFSVTTTEMRACSDLFLKMKTRNQSFCRATRERGDTADNNVDNSSTYTSTIAAAKHEFLKTVASMMNEKQSNRNKATKKRFA